MRALPPDRADFPLSRAGVSARGRGGQGVRVFGRGSSAAGYNLVMLMVLLTVLNIMIAASLPAWSAVIRRDKEEELIFRGLQYAEGIRLFKNRFERDPVRLEELIEVQPRTIRQLWKDPMTDDGKWALIPALAPGQVIRQEPNGLDNGGGKDPDGGRGPGGDSGDDQGEDQGGEDSGFGPKKGEIQVGPFKGVHSKSRKTSFLVFNGKDRYDEWHFTPELFTGGAPTLTGIGPGGQNPQPEAQMGMGQPPRARWIGRPLPEFLQPPQGTGLPQDDDQNLQPRNTDPDGRPPRKP